MPMLDYLDPDFEATKVFLQPQTKRVRSAFRSPISSSDLSFFYNNVAIDMSELYTQYQGLSEDILNTFKTIVETGLDGTKSIQEYASDLADIRLQIEKLK